MNLSDKTVAVTGASGFIGSHLAEYLADKVKKTIAFAHYNSIADIALLRYVAASKMARLNISFVDITDPQLMISSLKGIDVVFHLAGSVSIPYSYQAPFSFVQMNTVGALNVLEAARRNEVERFVHISTSEVYGSAQYIPIDESHPLNPQSVYAASKLGGEALARGYRMSYDMPVTVVRPFNTYGPRQSARAIVPAIITQALWRDKIELGNLDTRRDLTFVADQARGLALAAAADEAVGRIINLGTGSSISVRDLAGRIIDIVGRPLEIVQLSERMRPETSEVTVLQSDPGLAAVVLGWKAEVDLDSGLAATVDFIRRNPDLYRPEVYSI